MVSHELKTPLVVIGEYAEMLREDGVIGNPNKEQRDAVDILNKKLTLEKLGLLFLLSADVQSVGDFNQYFVSDAKKQSEMRASLKEALTKFDKVVEGL